MSDVQIKKKGKSKGKERECVCADCVQKGYDPARKHPTLPLSDEHEMSSW